MILEIILKHSLEHDFIVDVIHDLFFIEKKEIGRVELEYRLINYHVWEEKVGFKFHLELFIDDLVAENVDINNDLDFALKLLPRVNQEILISDLDNLPSTWWLIKKSGSIYKVKEKEKEEEGIVLNSSKMRLIANKLNLN